MQLKNVENNIVRLKRKNFLDTFNLKKNLVALYRLRKVYYSNIEVSIVEKNICLNANIFFPTDKLMRYKRALINRNNKFLKNKAKVKKVNKLFLNKNITVRTRILNKEVKKEFETLLLNNLMKFNSSFFSKRFNMFYDLLKITTLASFDKENIHLFTRFLGLVFRALPKRRHNLFISFLKLLINLIVVQNDTNISGIKIIINGKLQGKLRAKTLKIQTGAVSINSIKNKPIQSKIHIYTIYGTYGLQILANYKK